MRNDLPYMLESRIRDKISRWGFSEPAGWVARRITKNFELFSKRLPPATISSYLRALWNGVPTSRRMASLKSFQQRNCVFNCSATAADSLEHYCRCHVLRKAVSSVAHTSAAVLRHPAGIDLFFARVRGLSLEDRIVCARLVYTSSRLIHFARIHGEDQD